MIGAFIAKGEIAMMKLVTRIELSRLSVNELRGFYSSTFNQLVRSQRESQLRSNALATLENISKELNEKYQRSP